MLVVIVVHSWLVNIHAGAFQRLYRLTRALGIGFIISVFKCSLLSKDRY